ncbi:MAG TPA: PDZ domain-containing protein [Pirellulales bacterium]|jgi:S1-C subfamily serine protease|nr:PDZ domain-containing protein [Pirellulales bacterium]
MGIPCNDWQATGALGDSDALPPNSPADKDELEPGDVVIEFNGEKIHEPSELRLLVAGAKSDSTVKLKIIRDGKQRTVEVSIGARKGNSDNVRSSAIGPFASISTLNLRTICVESARLR